MAINKSRSMLFVACLGTLLALLLANGDPKSPPEGRDKSEASADEHRDSPTEVTDGFPPEVSAPADSTEDRERPNQRQEAVEALIRSIYGQFEPLAVEVSELSDVAQKRGVFGETDLLLGVEGRGGFFQVYKFEELSEEGKDLAWQFAHESMNVMLLQLEFMEEEVRTGRATRFKSVEEAEIRQKEIGRSAVRIQYLHDQEECYLVDYSPLFESSFFRGLQEDVRRLHQEAKVSLAGSLHPNF